MWNNQIWSNLAENIVSIGHNKKLIKNMFWGPLKSYCITDLWYEIFFSSGIQPSITQVSWNTWSQNKSFPTSWALVSFLCTPVSIPVKRRKQQPDPSATGLHRYRALLRTRLKPEKMEPAVSVTRQQWEPDRWDCRQCISPVPACCHL